MEEAKRWTDRAIRRQIDLSNLTAERERHLLRIVHGSSNERNKQTALIELWESHSKLVVAIASRYRTSTSICSTWSEQAISACMRRSADSIRIVSRPGSRPTPSAGSAGTSRTMSGATPARCGCPVPTPTANLVQMRGRLLAEARKSCQRERVEPTESELCERIGRRIGLSGR